MTNQKPLKQLLLIPGPTPVPHDVAIAGAKPMINHRSADFKKIIQEITGAIQHFLGTKNDVFTLTSSGTGGLEAAIVNVLAPGEKVLSLSVGSFGERFQKICKTYGIEFEAINYPAGKGIDAKQVAEALAKDKDKKIKAVLLQQNETSTAVLNDVKAVAAEVKKHGALVIVDAVSGFLAAPLEMDAWGLDVVVSGSQKAFMSAPGLAFVAVSARAYEKIDKNPTPRFYFDLRLSKKFFETGETPWTPAVATAQSVHTALMILKEEGAESIFARHARLRNAVRAGVRALGFGLLADDSVASPAVTAIVPTADVDAEKFRALVRNEFGVVLAGGQGDLKGKIFRIGHLGYVTELDIISAFAAMEMALVKLGKTVKLGSSVQAIQEVLLDKTKAVA